jgi:hypothetical protein
LPNSVVINPETRIVAPNLSRLPVGASLSGRICGCAAILATRFRQSAGWLDLVYTPVPQSSWSRLLRPSTFFILSSSRSTEKKLMERRSETVWTGPFATGVGTKKFAPNCTGAIYTDCSAARMFPLLKGMGRTVTVNKFEIAASITAGFAKLGPLLAVIKTLDRLCSSISHLIISIPSKSGINSSIRMTVGRTSRYLSGSSLETSMI